MERCTENLNDGMWSRKCWKTNENFENISKLTLKRIGQFNRKTLQLRRRDKADMKYFQFLLLPKWIQNRMAESIERKKERSNGPETPKNPSGMKTSDPTKRHDTFESTNLDPKEVSVDHMKILMSIDQRALDSHVSRRFSGPWSSLIVQLQNRTHVLEKRSGLRYRPKDIASLPPRPN